MNANVIVSGLLDLVAIALMAGDGALFTREDAVEAAWAVVDPVLENQHRARPYKRHGWGPKEADAIVASPGRWHNPKPKEASG